MEFVKKHWMITLLFFFVVSLLFTIVVFRESLFIKFESLRIEEIRLSDGIKAKPSGQVLYNYHRASERKAEMIQSSDVPVITDDGRDGGHPEKSFIYHKVEQGETLWKIAQRYNVSIDNIVSHNGITNPDLIYCGSTLKIVSDS